MVTIPSIMDQTLGQQRLLVREDFNVPMDNGIITDEARIVRALPGIRHLLAQGAAVILCSHLGRPQEGQFDPQYSLAPVAKALSAHLGVPVPLVSNWLQGVDVQPGEVVLCENVRFCEGESANDSKLSQAMAQLCDVFVMDAFATAHRAHASTVGVISYAKHACAGPLLMAELSALGRALDAPSLPLLAVVGGAKVSTKIQLLESLLKKVQVLFVGGGIANTFLKATGVQVGKSLYEPDFVPLAGRLLEQVQRLGVEIPLPTDVRVATSFHADAPARVCAVDDIQANELILDVGPNTAARYPNWLNSAKTVIWNGPVGVFEFNEFAHGTRALGQAIAQSPAFSIAGGGDTLAALSEFGLSDSISYISTGGGAFLSYLQGDPLPAVAALQQRVSEYEQTS